MNIRLLAVVTPPSIYHGCSNGKTFWEEKFTGEEKLFSAVNMKIMVIALLRKIRISRIVTSMSPCTSH